MADITEEDVERKRIEVEKLRAQLAEAQTTREDRERSLSAEIAMGALNAEEARLRAELIQAREAAKASTVKAGAAAVLDTERERTKQSTEQAKAVEAAAKSAGKE